MNGKQNGTSNVMLNVDVGNANPIPNSRHERIELLKKRKQMLQEELDKQSANKIKYTVTSADKIKYTVTSAGSLPTFSRVAATTERIKSTCVSTLVDENKPTILPASSTSSLSRTPALSANLMTLTGPENGKVSIHGNALVSSIRQKVTSSISGAPSDSTCSANESVKSSNIPFSSMTKNTNVSSSSIREKELHILSSPSVLSHHKSSTIVSIPNLLKNTSQIEVPSKTKEELRATTFNIPVSSSGKLTSANNSTASNVSVTQLMYGQLGVLPGNSQPVLFIQSPSTSNAKAPYSPSVITTTQNSQFVKQVPLKTVVTPGSNASQIVRLIPVANFTSNAGTTAASKSNHVKQSTLQSYVLNVINSSKKTSAVSALSSASKTPVALNVNKSMITTLTPTFANKTTTSLPTCSSAFVKPSVHPFQNVTSNASSLTYLPANSLKITPISNSTVTPLKAPSVSSFKITSKDSLTTQSSKVGCNTQQSSTASTLTFKDVTIVRDVAAQSSYVPATLDPSSATSMTIQGGEILRITKPQQQNKLSAASSTNAKVLTEFSPIRNTNKVPNLSATKLIEINPNVMVRVSNVNDSTSTLQEMNTDKTLLPINSSGSARTNGIKPYRRADTIVYQNREKNTTVNEDNSQFPMIAGYKSLAGEINSKIVGDSSNQIKLNVSSVDGSNDVTVTDISCAVSLGSSCTTSFKTCATQPPKISGVFTMSTAKKTRLVSSIAKTRDGIDVVDLTSEPSEEAVLKKEQHTVPLSKDTLGILRTDKKEFNANELTNERIRIHSGFTRRNHVDPSVFRVQKKKKNRTKRRTIEKVKPSSVENVAKASNRFLEWRPVSNHGEAPTSYEKISRMFFALDRLYSSRKNWESIEALERCMDSLYALRNALLIERNKQMLFMDENIAKLKQKALTVKTKEKIKQTPAQKLLEKFSLEKFVHEPKERDTEKSKYEVTITKKTVSPSPASITPTPQPTPVYSSRCEKRKTFSEIMEEQRRRKELKKQTISHDSYSYQSATTKDVKREVCQNTSTEKPATYESTEYGKNIVPYTNVKTKMSLKQTKSSPKQTKLPQKQTRSPQNPTKSPQKQMKTPKPVQTKTPQPVLLLKIKEEPLTGTGPVLSRTRTLSRKSNPKDPFNSAEDRMLQQALALSLKTANEERRKYQGSNRMQTNMPSKRKNETIDDIRDDMRKKRRPTEIDQLVDEHWNESWLKDSPSSSGQSEILSPTSSIREERALHYAIAKFAEMEYEKERVKSPPIEKAGNESGNIKQSKKDMQEAKVSSFKGSMGKGRITKKNINLNSRKKKLALVKKAKAYQNKVRAKPSLPTANVVVEKFTAEQILSYKKPTSKKSSVSQQQQQQQHAGFVQKKEYLLVPKYHGFKDFTPIVVDSRTRRQASSEDRTKLKKAEFSLMVVEKVGNQTKEIIVKEGESKEKKLAEASNALQKQFESLSKKKRYLTCSRSAGETVLHKAARLGYDDLAELSIQQGADVHARDNAGWSALHEACAYGKLNVVRVLLKYGADPNCFSNSGVRPLHDAVEKKDLRVIRLLLSYGADLNIAAYTGALPSDIARVPVVKKFLEDVKKDQSMTRDENDEIERPWLFQGSCEKLDTNDCSGIFEEVPVHVTTPYFDFIMSNRSMPQSFYLPYKNEDDVIVGHRTYFIFSEILERLNLSRKAFLKHHKVELRILPWTEFAEYVRQSTINHLPDRPGCSSEKDEEIELVNIGHYTLKKMFGMKGHRIDF